MGRSRTEKTAAVVTAMDDPLELKDTETLYESLFDGMLDGIAYCKMIFDRDGQPTDFTFLKVNKNYERLTGMKGVVGKNVISLIPGIKESNPEMFDAFARVALTGKPEQLELYVEPLKRWFSVSSYSPKKGYLTAILQNITDRKRIEQDLEQAKVAALNVLEDLQAEKEALAHANAKDEAMLVSIGDGLVTTDIEGRITLVNPAFERILGWTQSEVRGKLLADVVPMTDETGLPIPSSERLIQQCITQRITVTAAARYYKKKNETIFPAAITIAPILLGDDLLGTVEVFRDITKETDIDRAKTEFVSLASHQLKTPMTTIGWYAEMLLAGRAGKMTGKSRVYLEKIFHNNHRMEALVNALLNVSKIDMGTLAIAPQPVHLRSVMESVMDELARQIRQMKLQITLDLPERLPPVLADPQLMRMIFQNLLSNAVKYSSENGAISLTIGIQGTNVLIKISDKGCGIPKAQQSKIFTKLFRADNAREKDTDGTGLGLYIAKAVIEQSGGSIRFESIENKGTDFFVTLPLKSALNKTGTYGLI